MSAAVALERPSTELPRVPCPRCGKPLMATNGHVLAVADRWVVSEAERAPFLVTEHRCRRCGSFTRLKLALPAGVVGSG